MKEYEIFIETMNPCSSAFKLSDMHCTVEPLISIIPKAVCKG